VPQGDADDEAAALQVPEVVLDGPGGAADEAAEVGEDDAGRPRDGLQHGGAHRVARQVLAARRGVPGQGERDEQAPPAELGGGHGHGLPPGASPPRSRGAVEDVGRAATANAGTSSGPI
jgi:hypothetical protein